MNINAQTKLNLVVGDPITHSLSPLIHQTVYDLLGINCVLLAVNNPSLPHLIQTIKTLSIGMTAVTLPFKTNILSFIDQQSDSVTALQAANTLLLEDNKVYADNTDVDGVVAALSGVDLKQKNVLIIGAGGAAKAVAYALKPSQPHFLWMNRTASHTHLLQSVYGGDIMSSVNLDPHRIDVIINTTPIGMHPMSNESPLPNFAFHSNHVVFDLVYNPRDTALLTRARHLGAHCISGIHMLIAQALRQIELFSKQPLDKPALTMALLKVVGGDS